MDNCKVSEYGEVFQKTKPAKRGPFVRPADLLSSKGEVEYNTVHADDFVSHHVEQRKIKEPEKYVAPQGKMDVDTEYHAHYLGERAIPAKRPMYLTSVTQRIPSGELQKDTTNKSDFRKYSSVERSVPISNVKQYTPPKSPFTATTLHRADFQRFNQPPQPSARQPDKISTRGEPILLDTSHKSEFKRYSISKKNEVPKKEEYRPPSKPFDGNSLMHTDYISHLSPRKAEIHKPVDTVLKSDQPMERQTTNLDDFKNWPVKTYTPKVKQDYKKPDGQMTMMSTSSDYKNFGVLATPARSARPKTKLRTGRDGMFCGISNYSTDFKIWGSTPALPVRINDELTKIGYGTFDYVATSEHKDAYKRHNTAPARIFKPGTSVFRTKDAMGSSTVYASEFDGRPGPLCPSDALLKGTLAGISFQDDEDTGHRYVIGSISSNSILKSVLPSIADSKSTAASSIENAVPANTERNEIAVA